MRPTHTDDVANQLCSSVFKHGHDPVVFDKNSHEIETWGHYHSEWRQARTSASQKEVRFNAGTVECCPVEDVSLSYLAYVTCCDKNPHIFLGANKCRMPNPTSPASNTMYPLTKKTFKKSPDPLLPQRTALAGLWPRKKKTRLSDSGEGCCYHSVDEMSPPLAMSASEQDQDL